MDFRIYTEDTKMTGKMLLPSLSNNPAERYVAITSKFQPSALDE
jgi:hypothetical protein